jgi:hypothetical protein
VLVLVAVPVAPATHALSPGASLYSVVSEIVTRAECCGNGQTGLCVLLGQAEIDVSLQRDVLPLTKRKCAAAGLSEAMFCLCLS